VARSSVTETGTASLQQDFLPRRGSVKGDPDALILDTDRDCGSPWTAVKSTGKEHP
jgi:hypothetical protein